MSDQIKILIPVPQELYEPGLLKRAAPDNIFEETERMLKQGIVEELMKRQVLRDMGSEVEGAIDRKKIPKYPFIFY